MTNMIPSIVVFIALLTTILPLNSSGTLYDITFGPLLIIFGFLNLFKTSSINISLYLIYALISLTPLFVNILTCAGATQSLAIGNLARSLYLLFFIGFLLKDLNSSSFFSRKFISGLVLFLFSISLFSIISFVSGASNTFSTPFVGSISRSFNGDPHVFGPLMAYSSIYGLYLLPSSFRLSLSSFSLPPKLNTLLLLSFSTFTCALSFLSGSRGSLLVYISFALFYIVAIFGQRVCVFFTKMRINTRTF